METFDEWYQLGVRSGWCSAIVCQTHDGTPTTATEDEDWGNGDEPCIPIIRMYHDEAERKAVEANHAPSVWRKSNDGLA
jgi:hypothetical protein